jgi:undecaprenyl-diphosphatase
MSAVQSLALGALQGLSEFLPISSSGHLLLARRLMGLGEVPVLYDVLLHVATLVVVIVVFRRRIGRILASFGRWVAGRSVEQDAEDLRLLLCLLLATAVTAVVGFVVDRLEPRILVYPKLLAVFFLATGLILLATLLFRGERGYRQLGIPAALLVGLAQGIGALPAVSRSGITIAASLACGLEREKAGEFAFLLAIPAILGALLLKLRELGTLEAQVGPVPLAVGFLASFAVGLASLALLLRIVRRGRLAFFSIYLIPLSVAAFFLL